MGVEKPLAAGSNQVCLENSPVFSNSSGRFCFAKNPVGNFYSKLSCAKSTTTSTPTPTPTGECRSEACSRLSEFLQSKMNTSINPCDDFYRFSCGAAKMSTRDQMEENIGERLEVLLTDEAAGRHPWTKALISYFKSCRTRNEQDGRAQMRRILDKVGGWPVLEGSNWVEKDWWEIEEIGGAQALVEFSSTHMPLGGKNSSDYPTIWDSMQAVLVLSPPTFFSWDGIKAVEAFKKADMREYQKN